MYTFAKDVGEMEEKGPYCPTVNGSGEQEVGLKQVASLFSDRRRDAVMTRSQ